MNKTDLTPDDISNLFLFFRIPTPLYNKWQNYAQNTKQEMKSALAELLSLTSSQLFVPPYKELGYIDITQDWERKQPKMYKEHKIKQFHLKYTKELQKEIFNIFMLTDYKNQTPEMNEEICARLDYALKLKKY